MGNQVVTMSWPKESKTVDAFITHELGRLAKANWLGESLHPGGRMSDDTSRFAAEVAGTSLLWANWKTRHDAFVKDATEFLTTTMNVDVNDVKVVAEFLPM
jgi:hypothetical protein